MARTKLLAPNQRQALHTWIWLNAFLSQCKDEGVLAALLTAELQGKQRRQFALRIHSRLNRVRYDGERARLMSTLPRQKAGRRRAA